MSETTLPALSVADIIGALDGVVNASVDQAGSTKPLLECITAGVLRGAVVMLGTDASAAGGQEAYVALIKQMLANDLVVLALGYAEQVALDAGLVAKEADALAGEGLKRVCELANIPPVLPLGGLENVGNVVTIAGALCADSGLTVPQLPVVGVDAAAVAAADVELGNTFAGLGVDVFAGVGPFEGSEADLKAAAGLKDGEDAVIRVFSDLKELGDAVIADIEKKREALSL